MQHFSLRTSSKRIIRQGLCYKGSSEFCKMSSLEGNRFCLDRFRSE